MYLFLWFALDPGWVWSQDGSFLQWTYLQCWNKHQEKYSVYFFLIKKWNLHATRFSFKKKCKLRKLQQLNSVQQYFLQQRCETMATVGNSRNYQVLQLIEDYHQPHHREFLGICGLHGSEKWGLPQVFFLKRAFSFSMEKLSASSR
jgi:hypothetical protein